MGPEVDEAVRHYRKGEKTRRIAAGVSVPLLLAVVGGYSILPLIELRTAQPEIYASANGKIREVTLSDGTRLTLANDTKVEVRYTRHDRVVALPHGAIFADVAHDPKRPFRIDTGDARIVDIGTGFEVVHRLGQTRVAVAFGVVQFGRNGWLNSTLTLNAQQIATLDETGLRRLPDAKRDDIARWRAEWVEYKGAPLREVVADLQPLSPLPIEIGDDRTGDKPVSGRIRLTDPVSQLENLAITHNFVVRRTADTLVLTQ